MSLPDWKLWKPAVDEEYNSLVENKVFELVDPPPGVNIIGSRWLFKKKYDVNGELFRYKARLVAQGFTQVHGTDYFEAYAPVVDPATMRTILTISAN